MAKNPVSEAVICCPAARSSCTRFCPVVDAQPHQENRFTDGPTEQKDEDKDLAAGHTSHHFSV
jgi:hypothetical protein